MSNEKVLKSIGFPLKMLAIIDKYANAKLCLRFERERAEAGALLPKIENQQAKDGLPLNASEQDNSTIRTILRLHTGVFLVFSSILLYNRDNCLIFRSLG